MGKKLNSGEEKSNESSVSYVKKCFCSLLYLQYSMYLVELAELSEYCTAEYSNTDWEHKKFPEAGPD